MPVELSTKAKELLRLLRTQDRDGYSLMRLSGANLQDATDAVDELLKNSIVQVKGNAKGEEFSFAHIWVRPEAQKYADFVTGRIG